MSLCRHEMNNRPKKLSKEEVERFHYDTEEETLDE